MPKHEDDFEFEALMSINAEESEADQVDTPMTPEEGESVKKIEALGFTLSSAERDHLSFEDTEGLRGSTRRRRYTVTRKNLQEVADGLPDYQDLEAYKGIAKSDGSCVEYMLHSPSTILPAGRFVERIQWDYQRAECGHEFDPRHVRTGKGEHAPGFHLTGPAGDVCIELSEISPVASFKMPNGRLMRSDFIDYTLKVMASSPKGFESSLGIAQRVADSLLFEFDAKYDLALNLIPWSKVRVSGRRGRIQKTRVSFPSTSVPREVAALFAFAAEAKENPPFAFLSYYQVLEYYVPLTSRRDALKRIRREIRDFSFDVANDSSVLKVLNSVERAKGLSEEEALKILVHDCVREGKLRQFFESDAFGEHFLKKGPISGVPAVNLKATNESIPVQTAKRVYALRNRIVHAKDDPKYAETPQLLPRSAEANALEPDISLVRFLALETVADAQD